MKILVPLDGSPLSEAVLPTVAALAARTGAEVELFSVAATSDARATPQTMGHRDTIPAGSEGGVLTNVPLLGEVLPPPAESREQAVERLVAELTDYLHGKIEAVPGARVQIKVELAANPAQAIIARARAAQVDVIAMATHGRSGLGHLLLGSVTEQVIRSGVAPVLAVRPFSSADET